MERIGANIYVETVYPGVNVGCIVTDAGGVCVDTPLLPGEAQRWRARIRSWGVEQVSFVVYTSGQSERTLGTQWLIFKDQLESKQPLRPEPPLMRQVARFERGLFPRRTPSPVEGPTIRRQSGAVVAHRSAWEQVQEYTSDGFRQSMIDMLGDRDPDMVDLKVVPPHITFEEQIRLFAGDVEITLLGAARGTVWVWLPEQRVLFAGDTVVVGTHPPLSLVGLHCWLDALEFLRNDPLFKDAQIVPGRGPLTDVSATEPLIDYLRLACAETERVVKAGGHKADLTGIAAELVPLFPVPDGHRDRVQRQIKLVLDELYDGAKAGDGAKD
jgi:glyoxylase-like metal-dependent hydrolase (beta-lactamase superfamily II)